MKHNVLFLSLFFLVYCCFFQAPNLCADRGGGKFQVELFGGFSILNPPDLNQQAYYDITHEEFLNDLQYQYYDLLLGDNFSYSSQVEGELKGIKNALPMGFRIKYSLNSSISISFGFKYLSRRQDSRVAYQYDVRSLNPDDLFYYNEFSTSSESSPYRLFVKAYVPLVGIHYKIKGNRFLDLEAYFTMGTLYAECSYAKQHQYYESNSYGYWYEENVSYEMKGNGKGGAIDTGIRMNLHVMKQIDIFIESGYALQKAYNFSGPGSKVVVHNDVNSSGYTESTTWEGTWGVFRREFDRPWGYFVSNYISNEYGTDNFVLDLSGFQVRIGISYTF